MKQLLPIVSLSLLFPALGCAQDKKEYPSLPSEVFSTYEPKAAESVTAETMAKAAQKFLDSLDPDVLKQASYPFDNDEKYRWTNTPPRGPQGGVRMGDLEKGQLKLALDLLSTVLSPQGYFKARNIPLADDELLPGGRRRPGFGAEDYWLAIFGEPSAERNSAACLSH